MKENQDIEQLFQSHFEDFEVTPPDSVKRKIDTQISGNKNRIIWWISGLVFLFITGYFTAQFGLSKLKKSDKQLAKNEVVNSKKMENTHLKADLKNQRTEQQNTEHEAINKTENDASATSAASTGSATAVSAATTKNKEISQNRTNNKGQTVQKSYPSPPKAETIPLQKGKQIQSTKKNVAMKKSTRATRLAPNVNSGKQKKNQQLSAEALVLAEALETNNQHKNSSAKEENNFLSNTNRLGISTNSEQSTSSTGNGNTTTSLTSTGSTTTVAETTTPVDSATQTNTTPPIDSSNSVVNNSSSQTKPPESILKKWSLGLYGGPVFGINTFSSSGNELSEKTSAQFSLELQRLLANGYSLSSGLAYTKRTDNYSYVTLSEIITNSLDSIPIYDTADTNMPIIGYTYFTTSDTSSVSSNEQSSYSISSFGIPIVFGKSFALGTNWGVDARLGAIVYFNTIKSKSIESENFNLTKNKTSLQVVGRVQANYSWNNLVFSAGVAGGLDFKPATISVGDNRKRYYITPQLGIAYQF